MSIPIDDPALHQAFVESARRHILMITNHGIHQWNVIPGLPDTGGQNVFVNQLTEALARFGFRITVVNRGGYAHPVTGELHTGIRYRDENQRLVYLTDDRPDFVRKEDMAPRLPALADCMWQVLHEEQSEINYVISHYWDAAQLGVLYNRQRALPIKHIWVPHSLGAIKKRNESEDRWVALRVDERIEIERDLLASGLDGVAATSSRITSSLIEDYAYAGPVLSLPPCVNPDRYFPRHQVPDDDPVWSFIAGVSGLSSEEVRNCRIVTEISRTDETKRKDVLIEAFARVHREYPNTLLVVSIDDSHAELAGRLRALIAARGIERHVAVVGSVWNELPMIYAVTDIYCTPSVMEGFGMSVQEAAATKVPIVASQLVPFVVEHLAGPEAKPVRIGDDSPPLRLGRGAIVAPADDVEAFATALQLLLADDRMRESMGEGAYHLTIPHFTWGHIVDDFIRKIGVIEQQLTRATLASILQHERLEGLSNAALVDAVWQEEGLTRYLPDGVCRIDPRSGDRILYNSARADRPHDNRPVELDVSLEQRPCAVCQGQTTGVIDVAELNEGFTFINKNLLPMVYPRRAEEMTELARGLDAYADLDVARGVPASGVHLLQWTSSIHGRDWHNMRQADRVVVVQRLAALERKLVEVGSGWGGEPFVSIIKNHGRLVGGSLVHGHQQVALTNVLPRRIRDNWQFEQQHGETFAAHLLRENPPELTVCDYGPAAVLVCPYFMRRPFDMLLLLRDTGRRHLFQLDADETRAVADGWHDALRAILAVMPRLGREVAYNVVTHNGPGAGLYFEFLPYTQERGGFENLGLFVCQGSPAGCAEQLREVLTQ